MKKLVIFFIMSLSVSVSAAEYRSFKDYSLNIDQLLPPTKATVEYLMEDILDVSYDRCSLAEKKALKVDSLRINRADIEEVGPIATLKYLKVLDLAENFIEDVSPLGKYDIFKS